jgi:hypothetical protein
MNNEQVKVCLNELRLAILTTSMHDVTEDAYKSYLMSLVDALEKELTAEHAPATTLSREGMSEK